MTKNNLNLLEHVQYDKQKNKFLYEELAKKSTNKIWESYFNVFNGDLLSSDIVKIIDEAGIDFTKPQDMWAIEHYFSSSFLYNFFSSYYLFYGVIKLFPPALKVEATNSFSRVNLSISKSAGNLIQSKTILDSENILVLSLNINLSEDSYKFLPKTQV